MSFSNSVTYDDCAAFYNRAAYSGHVRFEVLKVVGMRNLLLPSSG
jgi:hypothetical protein